MSEYLSRRDRKIAEMALVVDSTVFDIPYVPVEAGPDAVGSRRAIRRLERHPTPSVPEVIKEDAPKTSEIVLPIIDEAPAFSFVLGTAGEPRTGSILLPTLATDTGELKLVRYAREVDEAMVSLASEGFVSNVAPLPAGSWMRPADSLNLIPPATNAVFKQMHRVVFGSVMLVSVGGLLLAAYMLGIFN